MIITAPFPIRGRKVLLLAEGCFSVMGSKTAVCFLRYRREDVVAVLDSSLAGGTVGEAVGFGGRVPIVGSVEEALALNPEVVVVGVAPRGGMIDEHHRSLILSLAAAGVDVVSGLHQFLSSDEEIVAAARGSGARIWDVRKVEGLGLVGSGRGCTTGAAVVLVSGSDCNVGKMTAAYELFLELERQGVKAAWAATGQTGIILRGRGIAIDRVISDFVAGAAEELVNIEGQGSDVVVVEGQGSLIHPGYAAVTVGLMLGAMPDMVILAHEPGRKLVKEYQVPIPPLARLAQLHRLVMEPFREIDVVGVALNTYALDDSRAKTEVERARGETGLAVTDPVRFGAGELAGAVLDRLQGRKI